MKNLIKNNKNKRIDSIFGYEGTVPFCDKIWNVRIYDDGIGGWLWECTTGGSYRCWPACFM